MVVDMIAALDAGALGAEAFVRRVTDARAVPALIGALRRHQSDLVESTVIAALASIGDRRAISVLRVESVRGGPLARSAAALALPRCGGTVPASSTPTR